MKVLIIGCGYVGVPLGEELVRLGHTVFGLRRTAAVALADSGIEPLTGDVTDPESLKKLPNRFDWVVNTIAAGGGGPDEYRRVYLRGTANVIDWLGANPPKSFVYTSSTSVYGQDDGSTVTEDSATEPEAETSRVLVETEQLLAGASKTGKLPAVVLRCAGIYGPERGYWLKQFLRGEAVLESAGDRWINMIHRDDVAGAILAALQKARPGSVYNVVDEEPVRQKDMFEWLAQRLRREMPGTGTEPARRRGASNKRISSARARLELEWKLKYPSFREGYEAELVRQGLGD